MTANFFGASSADVESMALSNPFCKDVHVFNSSLSSRSWIQINIIIEDRSACTNYMICTLTKSGEHTWAHCSC